MLVVHVLVWPATTTFTVYPVPAPLVRAGAVQVSWVALATVKGVQATLSTVTDTAAGKEAGNKVPTTVISAPLMGTLAPRVLQAAPFTVVQLTLVTAAGSR